MMSSNGAVAVAVCGAFTFGGDAVTQDANCNVNGTPDAGEVAAGLLEDCDGIGILNLCGYARFAFEAEAYLFGTGSPLVVSIDEAHHAILDGRFSPAVRADLDGITRSTVCESDQPNSYSTPRG